MPSLRVLGLLKTCKGCDEDKPLTEYYVNRTFRDGLSSKCKECIKAYHKLYYEANRDSIIEKTAQWRKAHPLARKNESARREQLHPGAERERSARRRREDPEGDRRAKAKWKREHPQQVAKDNANRRARRIGAFVEDVDPQEVLLLNRRKCGICGFAIAPDTFEVDHIIPYVHGGKHSYANTQPAHPECNSRKGGKFLLTCTPRFVATERNQYPFRGDPWEELCILPAA